MSMFSLMSLLSSSVVPIWLRGSARLQRGADRSRSQSSCDRVQTSQRPADGGEMSCVHPGGLARTERLHSAATKMTCHTLKCVESVQTSSLFTRLAEHMLSEEERKGLQMEMCTAFHLSPGVPGRTGRWRARVTPAFPFYSLINVILSSKGDCSRCFSAFSRLSGRIRHITNSCKYRTTAGRRN